jgi:hypothetical protein
MGNIPQIHSIGVDLVPTDHVGFGSIAERVASAIQAWRREEPGDESGTVAPL